MDEQRFKSCVMPLHKTLYAYALSILRDESDAADCLQDALTKLWENRKRLTEIDNPKAYAVVTIKNIAISMAAKRAQWALTLEDEPPDISDLSPTPSETMENGEDIRVMGKLLSQLPDNQRKVVMLSGVAGLSNNEIREATGLSDENVRVLLSRGRKKLRNLFSKWSDS